MHQFGAVLLANYFTKCLRDLEIEKQIYKTHKNKSKID